jgi:Xaa-Pro aminopeptidase
MPGKIAASLAAHGEHMRAAGEELHHISLGPGPELEAEWIEAGLELPDLDRLRRYRLDRVRAQLREFGYGGALLFDPMNIRYATDTTNMQIWVMHNGARYAWVSTDGPVIVWDFFECEFLSGHNELIDEVRPAIGSTFFLSGRRYRDMADRWAAEMISVITEHAGAGAQVAVDQLHHLGYRALEDAGFRVESGQEVMELARLVKSSDELRAMRCAVHACETTMREMHAAIDDLPDGMTERELWSMLHAGNISRAGEWVETQILSSGPRTNPWMQEASSRRISPGDMVAYDTDLVGAYGMMVDVSRSRIAGGAAPNVNQSEVFELAREQILRNTELLTVGRSLTELSHKAYIPPVDSYRHYCCLFHGVGQCDEYPDVFVPDTWDDVGYDDELQAGMVLTVESFVGRRDGGEGVKLENQVLITDTGPELLTRLPLDVG